MSLLVLVRSLGSEELNGHLSYDLEEQRHIDLFKSVNLDVLSKHMHDVSVTQVLAAKDLLCKVRTHDIIELFELFISNETFVLFVFWWYILQCAKYKLWVGNMLDETSEEISQVAGYILTLIQEVLSVEVIYEIIALRKLSENVCILEDQTLI